MTFKKLWMIYWFYL